MVEIGSIGSVWFQIASFFFFIVVLSKNFIQLRICILIGNMLFILNAILGWPFWPNLQRYPLVIAPDVIFWAGSVTITNFLFLYQDIKKLKIHSLKDFCMLLFLNKRLASRYENAREFEQAQNQNRRMRTLPTEEFVPEIDF